MFQPQFAPQPERVRTGKRPGGTAARLAVIFASASVAAFVGFDIANSITFTASFLAVPAIILAMYVLRVRRGYIPRGIAVPTAALSVAVIALLAGAIFPLGARLPTIAAPNEGNQPIIYPHNPEMTQMTKTEFTVERAIRAKSSPGHWPVSVAVDPQQNVVVDGVVVATVLPGESIAYQVTKGGADFVLILHGAVQGEYIYYDYSTHMINGWCAKTDASCDDPFRSTGTQESGQQPPE